jgi:hypothetical protein
MTAESRESRGSLLGATENMLHTTSHGNGREPLVRGIPQRWVSHYIETPPNRSWDQR